MIGIYRTDDVSTFIDILSRYGTDITISRIDIVNSIYHSPLYRFQFRYEKSLYRRSLPQTPIPGIQG